MVRCPNCGENTSGDYCQCCKYPILKGSVSNRSIAGSSFFGFLAILSLCIAALGLWYGLIKGVTPRDDLREVRGQVTARELRTREGRPDSVYAELAWYDHRLAFYNPDEKVKAVYDGLKVGADVVLLVEEGDERATIWEGRSNGNIFLHYETVAQWQKSNNRWGLVLGFIFLAISGYFVLLSIRALKGQEQIL